MSTSETPAKKLKMAGPLIGTHNGHFHADEALAVYLLRLLPTYASSPLVRTRDPSVLSTCHTVVDVGGVYDASTNRYDHHQREFSAVYPGHNTKLSSAGLVYLHFGKDIIAQHTGLDVASEDVTILWEKLYTDLIESFDANDNGIDQYNSSAIAKAGIEKNFEERGFSIASVVGRYNRAPLPTSFSDTAPQAEEDARFARASEFTGEQFILDLSDAYKSWLPARATVTQAYNDRLQYDPHGRIMVIPYKKEGVPWSDHLYGLEKRTEQKPGVQAQVLYVLFPENGDADSKWRIRAVSKEGSGFENRKDLPDAWKGVRDEKLDEVSGIPGCVFVHAAGFIGGNKTFEGALKMAAVAADA
ncbi:metal-dependent protein hydrolase [Mytilinidion resinicola]|uniref:Metal-dependent protein hydrolase n=1 Tax=Mytilinidion resinicola TaxID=574789 RepID=A0A6A6YMD0_9PEZI|nr:metal-dependent protein hydrolase [Mytilinidion resinicola]KAF2809733.1 metal-dependent protein hydrolase [Mytilinidion resinicola]